MNINEWKRQAHLKLQEIEGRDSVYQHQKLIKEEERPSIFYTIPERSLSVKEVIENVRNNFLVNLPDSHYSNEIYEKVLNLLSRAETKINSLTSLFIAIETDWGTVDKKFTRNKFYDHYHPPRGDNLEISTLSYFEALYLEEEVAEKLNYCDMTRLKIAGKPYRFWKENNPADIAKDFKALSEKTNISDWKFLLFPKEGALEVAFDSFNNLHNISDLSGNMFLTIVINDVELKEKLSPGELKFTYLR